MRWRLLCSVIFSCMMFKFKLSLTRLTLALNVENQTVYVVGMPCDKNANLWGEYVVPVFVHVVKLYEIKIDNCRTEWFIFVHSFHYYIPVENIIYNHTQFRTLHHVSLVLVPSDKFDRHHVRFIDIFLIIFPVMPTSLM